MLNEIFLKILKTALSEEKPTHPIDICEEDWNQLFALADSHRLLPLVYDCVYEVCPLDEEAHKKLRSYVKALVSNQTLRAHEFLCLYNTLCTMGIKPIVVKGIICRSLYYSPDLRPSSDEDMLVSEEEFAKCSVTFAENNLLSAKKEDSYQNSFVSPSGLHIELHKSLFDPNTELFSAYNDFFENCAITAIEADIDGTSIKTLCPTDNLLYLILHALKHFVHSGVGIRQVCDIILFANRYGCKINWTKLFSSLKNVNAEKFACGLFAIGKKHLNLDTKKSRFPQDIALDSIDITALLDDILSAGIYGSASLARQHSSSITLGAAQGKKVGILKRAFPPLKDLDHRYNYAKKKPLLLPIAWGHRLLKYKKETKSTLGNTPKNTMNIGKKRVELLKSLGLTHL